MNSEALLQANQRLYELRAQLKASTQYTVPSSQFPSELSTDHWVLNTAHLPPHLGWESEAVTAVLRRRTAVSQPPTPGFHPLDNKEPPGPPLPETSPALKVGSGKVTVYPSIAIALLRQEQAATGRLWWLLRYLDVKGQGMLRLAEVFEQLTSQDSSLYLCSKRQLRHLLQTGEGVFWRRDRYGRLWLRSAAKVAFALGVTRLTGRPVAVPVGELLRGMGRVRAVLYATFHQGRKRPNPIARATLQETVGVSAQSQRTYERQLRITVREHFAIGPVKGGEAQEKAAWEKGTAAFEWRDTQGQHGRPGQCYVAWQLPNSYQHEANYAPHRGQRRINRQLSDLWQQGTTGKWKRARRRYCPHGAEAAKQYNRNREEVYWPASTKASCWYVLG